MATVLDRLNLYLLRRAGFRRLWLPTSQGRVHVLSAEGGGALPPVVLMAGLGSRASHFRRCVSHLLPKVKRVILPDLPGHGHSDVPDDGLTGPSLQEGILEALQAVLDEEPAVLMGNSLGGFMAVRHALHHPGDVLGLLLVSPGGAWMPVDEIRPFYDRFRVESHRQALRVVDAAFAGSYPRLRHILAWGARRQLTVGPPRNLIDSVEQDYLLTLEELARVSVPVRLVWGTADGVAPDSQLAHFISGLPDGTPLERPANYGHSPYLEEPRDLAERLLTFMRDEVGA